MLFNAHDPEQFPSYTYGIGAWIFSAPLSAAVFRKNSACSIRFLLFRQQDHAQQALPLQLGRTGLVINCCPYKAVRGAVRAGLPGPLKIPGAGIRMDSQRAEGRQRGNMEMIYFTSDLHFFHENAIQFGRRPYRNRQEMNEGLITNWNQAVGQDDEVYILGDLTMKGPRQALEVIGRLNGKK